MQLDYFYGNEAEQFTFYRIPKVLITSPQFKQVSDSAKILYDLMLDRMGLSIRNGWFDEQGRAYIFYKLSDIEDDINCSTGKAVKLLAELDTKKGIGLIERIKQGQGKADKIYLKKFVGTDNAQTYSRVTNSEKQDLQKSNSQTSKNCKSRLPKTESADLQKAEQNNNKYNNTDFSNTYPINSTEPEENSEPVKPQQPERIGMDKILAYRQLIKQNIEYDILCQKLNGNIGMLNEIVDIITETVCTTREYLIVASEKRDAETVKSQLLKLNSEHIEYVLDCMKNNTSDVHSTRQYMLAALYNAPSTIDTYYTLKVGHDLYGGR